MRNRHHSFWCRRKLALWRRIWFVELAERRLKVVEIFLTVFRNYVRLKLIKNSSEIILDHIRFLRTINRANHHNLRHVWITVIIPVNLCLHFPIKLQIFLNFLFEFLCWRLLCKWKLINYSWAQKIRRFYRLWCQVFYLRVNPFDRPLFFVCTDFFWVVKSHKIVFRNVFLLPVSHDLDTSFSPHDFFDFLFFHRRLKVFNIIVKTLINKFYWSGFWYRTWPVIHLMILRKWIVD